MPAIPYPKWVTVHTSYVNKNSKTGNISVPDWRDAFIARTGTVTVLVNNSSEEAKALASK